MTGSREGASRRTRAFDHLFRAFRELADGEGADGEHVAGRDERQVAVRSQKRDRDGLVCLLSWWERTRVVST